MDSVSTYTLFSLAWLSAQALPQIFWPSLISALLYPPPPAQSGLPAYNPANASLEHYFARSLGLAQLALAVLLLVFSGVLPLGSVLDAPPTDPSNPTPTATAAVFVTALYHAATASYSYSRYCTAGGGMAYLLGCAGGSVLAVAGLGLLMFGGERNARRSARTGKEKENVSGWPFRNEKAEGSRRRRG